jgi:cyanophycinase
MARRPGTLVIIGGHEDKEGDKLILRAVAERAGSKLVVATVASQGHGDELWKEYERIFRNLGVPHVYHLSIDSREEAKSERKARILDDATAVFFTGGDQLKITSQLGDSAVYQRVLDVFEHGGLIAGTSAGASVMCETMIVRANGSETYRIGATMQMAPGLGIARGVIIDQHFAERGRITRLVGAVAQNPRILGIGIDEDTAILMRRRQFTVLGAGGVYVVDGKDVVYSNIGEAQADRALSTFNLRLHLLSMGDRFDITTRKASARPAEELEKALLGSAHDGASAEDGED